MIKNPLASLGDEGLITGFERPSREGNGYPLQYFSLGSPMERGAWRATVHGIVKESHMT